MKLIKSQAELIPQSPKLSGLFKHIELCGRVSYKSEDKITDDSTSTFIQRLINNKHYAVLEHGTVYLKYFWSGSVCPLCNQTDIDEVLDFYCQNPYSVVNYNGNDVYITTNYRVLVENNRLGDLQYLSEPTEFHELRLTFKLTIDRAVAQEVTRHRSLSFVMESQRYCNYSKNKFGNEVTFIIPSWVDISEGSYTSKPIKSGSDKIAINSIEDSCTQGFLCSLEYCEEQYLELLKRGWSPQQARGVLPNATKTELIVTGFEKDFSHFFDLRVRGITGKPHPDMKYIATEMFNIKLKKNDNEESKK